MVKKKLFDIYQLDSSMSNNEYKYWNEEYWQKYMLVLVYRAIMMVMPIFLLGIYLLYTGGFGALSVINLVASFSVAFIVLRKEIDNNFKRLLLISILFLQSLSFLIFANHTGIWYILIITVYALSGLLLEEKVARLFKWGSSGILLTVAIVILLGFLDEVPFRTAGGSWILGLLTLVTLGLIVFELLRNIMKVITKKTVDLIDVRKSSYEETLRFRTIFEEAPFGIALIDSYSGRFLELNKKYSEITGLTIDELNRISWADITHPDDIREDQNNMDLLTSGKISGYNMQKRYIKPGGNFVWVDLTVVQVMEKNKIKRHLAMISDITDRKKLEEEQNLRNALMDQQQRLESIGMLAGGVAHEINNPLNGILNYSQIILDLLEDQEDIAEYASEIISETGRIAIIVKNLLEFSRLDHQQFGLIDVQDIIASILTLVQTVMRHDQIDFSYTIEPDMPKLRCISQQIQQVLINLLMNARDALNDKFPGYDEDKKILLEATSFLKDDKMWLRILVEDHGNGMPESVKDRVFEPFFTTKGRTEGTGLGLSISYGIIEEHNGFIFIESEEGKFTRFTIELPFDHERSYSEEID